MLLVELALVGQDPPAQQRDIVQFCPYCSFDERLLHPAAQRIIVDRPPRSRSVAMLRQERRSITVARRVRVGEKIQNLEDQIAVAHVVWLEVFDTRVGAENVRQFGPLVCRQLLPLRLHFTSGDVFCRPRGLSEQQAAGVSRHSGLTRRPRRQRIAVSISDAQDASEYNRHRRIVLVSAKLFHNLRTGGKGSASSLGSAIDSRTNLGAPPNVKSVGTDAQKSVWLSIGKPVTSTVRFNLTRPH